MNTATIHPAQQVSEQTFIDAKSLGYSPIPVNPVTRKPCIVGWQVYCTRQATDKEIKYWFRTFRRFNIAFCGGYNNVVFLDDDDPFMLSILGQILTAETTGKFGSKGVTAFYRSRDTKSRAMGVDGRACVEFLGMGRATTVPPSLHHKTGQPYQWTSPLRPADELPWLPENAAQACYDALVTRYGYDCYGNPNPPVLVQPTGRAGTPDGRMRVYAEAGLLAEADRVAGTPQNGRSNRLFQSACAVGKYVVHGVLTEAEVVDAFMAAADANGLLAEDGARSVVAQVRSGISKAAPDPLPDIGQTTPEEVFGETPPPVPAGGSLEPVPSTALTVINPFTQLMEQTMTDNVIDFPIKLKPIVKVHRVTDELIRPEPGLVHRIYPLGQPGSFSYLFGGYGSKKTWYALWRSICIAAGKPFMGHNTRQAFTAYYAAENVDVIRIRAQCICRHLGLDMNKLPFIIIEHIGDLNKDENMYALMETILGYTTLWGPCKLIDLDTATEAFAILDENAPREWLDIHQRCRALGQAIGGAVNALHHTGKDAGRGGRGSSAIGGSHDFSITVARQDDGSSRVGRESTDKMRTVSDTDFPTLAFRIEPYVMDTALDVFGDQWTSGYPVTCGLTADQPKRTVGDQALHDAFNAVNIGIFPESVPDLGWRNGKPSEDVRAQFMIHYDGKGNATANAKNVAWRTLRDLMKSGEHHEYRMIDDKTIISIAGVLKES